MEPVDLLQSVRDITGVLRVQRERIDYAYLEDWANRLGLSVLLRHVRERVQQL